MFNKDFYGKEIIGIGKFLKTINMEDFKKHLIDTYKFDNEDYFNMAYNKCRVSVAYLSTKLINSINVFRDTYVYYGYVQGRWHCWFEYNKYFIDLTYIQFDKTAPEVTIVKKEDAMKNNLYSISGFITLKRWLEQEIDDYEMDKKILDYIIG